ncbi:uncharacterized protein BDW43DRAFT_284116, partial [Aspergillus alliaceus]|uniref:uncharacterized protein n=1 Tax=Petromyces alliaceus TaxID=209559 RepID=UPI0012A441FE
MPLSGIPPPPTPTPIYRGGPTALETSADLEQYLSTTNAAEPQAGPVLKAVRAHGAPKVSESGGKKPGTPRSVPRPWTKPTQAIPGSSRITRGSGARTPDVARVNSLC